MLDKTLMFSTKRFEFSPIGATSQIQKPQVERFEAFVLPAPSQNSVTQIFDFNRLFLCPYNQSTIEILESAQRN